MPHGSMPLAKEATMPNEKPRCDCLNVCGDDPHVTCGLAEPCEFFKKCAAEREARERAAAELKHKADLYDHLLAVAQANGYSSVAQAMAAWPPAAPVGRQPVAGDVMRDAKDAARYRWLRERAWYVDAATYALELRERWSFGDGLIPDPDDVEQALDVVRNSDIRTIDHVGDSA